ncbi:MAG: ferredoxin family protein [Actinomycetia bacterium]|nr:ferredoxin family protein [Actinomycetes bacterium]
MTYVIASPCIDKKDRACVDECPVDAIYEGERTLYINPDECVDCGACEVVCPQLAIFYEDDLPPEERDFVDIQVQFFAKVGNLGGASRVGPLGYDEPRVADWPSQA